MTRIYVPRDSSALALGADALAQAIEAEAARRGMAIELVRNGSRGLLWLEPLVEVATAEGRVGYANVEEADVAALFDAGFIKGGEHARRVGVVDDIPYLKKQQRLTFARIGITDPLSVDDYVAHGGLEGLRNALQTDGDAACEALIESGLRGRGGARCAAPKRRRNTSSAMRTKATPALSLTVW
jgi:formate dehydrogenase iron-sulfur subunit